MTPMSPKQKKIRLAVAALGLIVFIVFFVLLKTGAIQSFDDAIRFPIYAGRTDGLTTFWQIITFFGSPECIILIAACLLLIPFTRKKAGLPAAACAIPGYLIYACLKPLIARPRPDAALWLVEETGFSFPSGHAMNGLICYGIVLYLIRRMATSRRKANVITVLGALLILGIGLSRVYLAVHYPSDILAGWALGLAWLMFATVVLETLNERYLARKSQL